MGDIISESRRHAVVQNAQKERASLRKLSLVWLISRLFSDIKRDSRGFLVSRNPILQIFCINLHLVHPPNGIPIFGEKKIILVSKK